ncbi:class IV adenylate cyclase [Planosporangium sp. 12N6]|uniref:class IV adenylate cyclase n=1 Tax=Planosporangium spinosum TaxID=3402278 RepID=UPI003CF8A6FC
MAGAVETESKHRVRDGAAVRAALDRLGFHGEAVALQADEYYDTPTGLLRAADLVVRLRLVGGQVTAGFKGPRTYLPDGSHARLEVELPAAAADEVRAELAGQGLVCVWHLQKRRREYRHPAMSIVVCMDELPALGHFLELEGEPDDIVRVRGSLGDHIGPAEPLNYRDLAKRWLAERGGAGTELTFTS